MVIYEVMALQIEICGSCLRGCEIAATAEEKNQFVAKLTQELKGSQGFDFDFEIEVGQCQRFCPENRVTLSMSKNPDGSDRRLGASPQGTYVSICEFISSRARAFLAK